MLSLLLSITLSAPAPADVRAIHHDGQTFVTWKDIAEGEAGAKFRYSLYRSDRLITAENLAQAELCYRGVFNNSAKLFGYAFNMKDRLDPSKPYSVIVEGGKPLPAWSGLAVVTTKTPGKRYYAVLPTDEQSKPAGEVACTTEPVAETPAPLRAIKLHDSKDRTGPYVRNTSITGKKGLPLHVTLHGSSGQGGPAGEYGDYFLHFGNESMGPRDGMPGVFSVSEAHAKEGNHLTLRPRDGLEHPAGRNMESYWLGLYATPQWAKHTDPRFYPFTEERLLWMTRFAIDYYGADPNRITMGGSSSGGVGSFNVGFRHPELFAAVYPTAARVRMVQAVGFDSKFERGDLKALMHDGKTTYYEHVDGPKFAAEHHEDLPFIGIACGRQDGYATWPELIDMVRALTANHHGFAFSWNNGNHGGGGAAMPILQKYYPHDRFARNQSYPAFGNSSIDDKLGNGDPKDGDLVGGINLGFLWKDVVDTPSEWSAAISNDRAKADMTVDVTPRRCQAFKLKPGDVLHWSTSLAAKGDVKVDAHGLVTIEKLAIKPGEATQLQIRR